MRARWGNKDVSYVKNYVHDKDMEGTPHVASFENANTPCMTVELRASSRCVVSMKDALTPGVSYKDSRHQMLYIQMWGRGWRLSAIL